MKRIFILTVWLVVSLIAKSQTSYTWTGISNNLFSDATNWNPNGNPTNIDDVQFDGSSVVNCDLDQVTNDVNNMDIQAGYTGNITNSGGNDLNLDGVFSIGYAFQIEMKYKIWSLGMPCLENPITFFERNEGKSKMSRKIIIEAVINVFRLRFRKFMGTLQ